MPIRSFREIPKNAVEWARFFSQTEVSPDPGSVGGDEIQDGAVTYQKLQNVNTDKILGRDSSPAGTVQELDVSGGLEFTGSGIRRSALSGDVTAPAGSGTTTITDAAVTYQKIQPVSSTDRILGRLSSGAGVIEEIVCTAAGRALLDDANATAQRSTLGLGTAAVQNTGTSGATVPLLDAANTWDGVQTFSSPPGLPSYTVASVPSATPAGRIAYISNESGGAVVAFSDGTNWRRVTDRAVIS